MDSQVNQEHQHQASQGTQVFQELVDGLDYLDIVAIQDSKVYKDCLVLQDIVVSLVK